MYHSNQQDFPPYLRRPQHRAIPHAQSLDFFLSYFRTCHSVSASLDITLTHSFGICFPSRNLVHIDDLPLISSLALDGMRLDSTPSPSFRICFSPLMTICLVRYVTFPISTDPSTVALCHVYVTLQHPSPRVTGLHKKPIHPAFHFLFFAYWNVGSR